MPIAFLASTIGTGSTLEDVFLVLFIVVAVLWIVDWLIGHAHPRA